MPDFSALVAVAVVLAVAILAALAILQLCVAFGAPLGHFVWGGRHRVLPARLRVGSVVSIVLYAFIALVLLARAGLVEVLGDGPFVVVTTWVIFGYFTLGIVANAISRSKPERYTMTPVCAVLAACTLVIALS
ncbi:MAG TPA: hypothetical protein VNT50_09775 [Microbacterium sp.]|uniref:hypothetical protein n=1 Tax=Microbacterium sp. TaxID=51671 RepID=UPI002C757350|nr:hypothetical protein [Microbacterium sp.]HWI31769.1 hypothetical protein [Microbacterium sp.]